MTTRKKPTRENKRYWLSYDLGLRGDYDSLYQWLDEHSASECGDSLATFKSNRTSDELRKELIDLLGETGKVRVYLIASGSGSFVIGKRKAAPWAGYSQQAVDNVLDQ